MINIPDLDPMVIPFLQELGRWFGANVVTLLIASNILMALKVLALKTESVVDDKIVSFLLYIVSFRWLRDIQKPPAGTEANPIELKDEVK